MRHGTDSDEAREVWRVLEQLCEWLDPELAEAPTAAAIQVLLQRVDQSLTQVCADKFAQDRIVDQLAAALFDQEKSQRQLTPVSARLNDTDGEPLSEAQDTLVERLRVGDWLQFKSLETPLNLVWIGNQPPIYVFANYRGIKKLDIKRNDLLKSLEDGEAEWTADLELPLMDRSYSAMIQKMQRDLMWQSSHDAATGLCNRSSFFRAIRRNWLRSKSGDGGFVTGVIQLRFIDAADEAAPIAILPAMLREFARVLPTHLPTNALLARAGDAAIAFWAEAADSEAARGLAANLMAQIDNHPLDVAGVAYRARSAAGITWTRDSLRPASDYDNASAACATAQGSGSPLVVYDSESGAEEVLALAEWAHALTAILAGNQLSLNCQPVVASGDPLCKPLYYEVLLHSSVNDHRRIATRDLVDVAERLQRITEIDRWVVRSVLQWMREHPDRVATIGGFAINLSIQSVDNPQFLKYLLAELAKGDIPAHKLIFEINETDAAEGHAQTPHFMRQLQRLGCRFAFDEFGPGSSSYTTLKSLKLDYLKLDRALVREVTTSVIDEALVRSIIETAAFLGLKTVACFVEDPETALKLGEMGVDCLQGYFVGEPQPLKLLA
jgi:EAL domain-containing protein (putative c-di-GMP-specific phosphodiesterase class I)